MPEKVSVVLSTYNGEKYIIDQLSSLLDQSYKPDEVIIQDDCSTDNTAMLANDFIEEHHLNNWKVLINSKNIGWKMSFWKALHKAHNEIIFLCDQDDIWMPNKICEMRTVLLFDLKIELLACDYTPFYNKKLSDISSSEFYDVDVEKIDMKHFLKVNRPGCSFAIRKSLLHKADSFWTRLQPHDFTLWNTGILYKSAYFYHKSLMNWRVHKDSADYSLTSRMDIILFHPIKFANEIYDQKLEYLQFNLEFMEKTIGIISRQSNCYGYYNLFSNRLDYLTTSDYHKLWKSYKKFKSEYTLKVVLTDAFLVGISKYVR